MYCNPLCSSSISRSEVDSWVYKDIDLKELNIKKVNYELHSSNGIDLYGQLNTISIATLDSTQLNVPAVMNVDNRLVLISEILLDKDQMTYSFVLKGTIESLTGIAEQDIPVTVNTVGQMELYNEDKRDRPKIAVRKKKQ